MFKKQGFERSEFEQAEFEQVDFEEQGAERSASRIDERGSRLASRRSGSLFSISACFAAYTLFCACAHAAPIDPAGSQVTATFRQLGVPISGRFRQIQGDVEFDPARPAAARATVEIAVQSFDLGDKDYNAEVAKKDWFDAVRHPRAEFVLRQVQGSGGAFKADGQLSIKGRTVPVQFPVSLRNASGKTMLEGRLPVSRLAFAIGEGEWKDTSLVADEVLIEFRLLVPGPVAGASNAMPAGTAQANQQPRPTDGRNDFRKDSGKENRK